MKKKPQQTKEINSISDLRFDDRNANKGTTRGRAMIAESLTEFGAGRSVLADRNGNLIAGNKTVEAAQSLLKDVIVVKTDGKQLVVVQRTDLDLNDPAARQLAVLDNRTGEVSLDWDAEMLQRMQEEGIDLTSAFDPSELSVLIAGIESESLEGIDPEAPVEFPSYDENIETEHRCPKCHYTWSGSSK